VHVYAETRPGPEFEPVEPDLEDVYFSVMARSHGRLTAEPKCGKRRREAGEVFRFEVAYRLRQPSTWVYAALLTALPVLMMHAFAERPLHERAE
jgi:hypothetical protein